MTTIKHIIFDFDGTLVDSAPAILATYQNILAQAGLVPILPLDEKLIGPPLKATLQKILGTVPPETLEQLVKAFQENYDTQTVLTTAPYVDATQSLSTLSEHFNLHIATNKRKNPTLKLIQHLHWPSFFQSIYCIDTAPEKYSNKSEMIKTLLIDTDIKSEESIYIGDTYGDFQAANDCGIRFFAANWGYGEWTINETETVPVQSHVYDSLHTLTNALIPAH